MYKSSFPIKPTIGVVLAASVGVIFAAGTGAAVHRRPPADSLPIEGKVAVNEASGVVRLDGLSGDETVIIEGNEKVEMSPGGKKIPDIQIVPDAGKRFARNSVDANIIRLVLDGLNVDDIEEIAWDPGRRAAFLIGSHSKNPDNDVKPKRRRLARVLFDKEGDFKTDDESAALEGLMRHTFAFVPHALDDASQEVGGPQGAMNIEGAVFLPTNGTLLLGLRSPTAANGSALVLSLTHPHGLFDGAPAARPKFDPHPLLLPLGGQGIRGMTYDPDHKGCWILSGKSAHDQTHEPWHLWFWKPGSGKPPVRQSVPHLSLGAPKGTPEGICCLTVDGKPALLIVEDRNKPESRYAIIPKPPAVP